MEGRLWAIDLPGGRSAVMRGAVLGNTLFLFIAWIGLALCGILVGSCLHDFSLLEAIERSHAASLFFPLFSMVLIPLTANGALLVDVPRTMVWRLINMVVGIIALTIVAVSIDYHAICASPQTIGGRVLSGVDGCDRGTEAGGKSVAWFRGLHYEQLVVVVHRAGDS